MGKKKKSHKKDHKKKKAKKDERKERRRSSSRSTTTSSSRSSSRSSSSSNRKEYISKTVKQSFDDYAKNESNVNWHLAQKSETLLFDQIKEQEKTQESFIWRKKNQKIGIDKLEPQQVMMLSKLKQEETKRELEKLEKRKLEREREREERDREREFLQRQKESEYHKEWESQEDSFQLKQVKLRSQIRIEEGRAKPIDLLAKYISADNDGLDIEMHEPYTYLNGLNIRDLEDLLEDIKVYSDLEGPIHEDYWRDMTLIAEDELKKLQKMDKYSRDHAGDRREGINQSVLQDVASLFKGKSFTELIQLEEKIKNKIQFETGIDINYWESLLTQLKAHIAKARLKDKHQEVLKTKLESLKKKQGIVSKNRETKNDDNEDIYEKRIRERIRKEEESYKMKQQQRDHEESKKIDQITKSIEEYEMGNYSPRLISQEDLPLDTFIITQEEDDRRLESIRNEILGTGSSKRNTEDEFEARARKSMAGQGGEEEDIDGAEMQDVSSSGGKKSNTQEVALTHHYLWSDKYRPRKPRYYNRVHTGYDWNQYNKKHYDVDNPPPKTVQGYKFNIFYPDLIDKTKTPRYSITVCQDNKDFAILRFHAGAPYEDVAFKIVNREWDISYRHGFRNQFQNGIYQLWFHFRKWKYRR